MSHRETCPRNVPVASAVGSVRIIHLTQGQAALVEAADYARLSRFPWHAVKRSDGKGYYAARAAKGRRVWMHHAVLRTPRGQKVDHRNGDGLDNRRANLRPCTQRQNIANRALANRSGFRGVQQAPSGRWRVRLRVGGQETTLGTFDTAEQAARVYDAAAWAEHGEFATLNFPR